MFCVRCGKQNIQDANFCFSCGVELHKDKIDKFRIENFKNNISSNHRPRKFIMGLNVVFKWWQQKVNFYLKLYLITALCLFILYFLSDGIFLILCFIIMMGSLGLLLSWIGYAKKTRYHIRGSVSPIEPSNFMENIGLNIYLIILSLFSWIYLFFLAK
jgi:hypothetical protein